MNDNKQEAYIPPPQAQDFAQKCTNEIHTALEREYQNWEGVVDKGDRISAMMCACISNAVSIIKATGNVSEAEALNHLIRQIEMIQTSEQ